MAYIVMASAAPCLRDAATLNERHSTMQPSRDDKACDGIDDLDILEVVLHILPCFSCHRHISVIIPCRKINEMSLFSYVVMALAKAVSVHLLHSDCALTVLSMHSHCAIDAHPLLHGSQAKCVGTGNTCEPNECVSMIMQPHFRVSPIGSSSSP